MQTLSKDAEEKVIAAVKRAVALVDGQDLDPTAAIEKVAREESWGPEMLRFASHAYNTGRQTAQRESADNALDKFAAFPLADPDSAIAAIWPAHVKTAAEIHYAGVSAEYRKPPAWLEPREAEQKLARLKAASARMTKAAEAKVPPVAAGASLGQALKQDLIFKRAAAVARHEAAAAYEKMASRMGALADYFGRHALDRESFGCVEKAAGVYFGQSGLDLMDWVFRRNRMERFKTARAGSVKWGRDRVTVDLAAEPWNHVSACLELARQVNQKRAAEAAAKEASDRHAQDVLRPFAAAPDPWLLVSEKQAMNPLKLLDIASDTKNLSSETFGDESTRDPVNDAYEKLDDPAHASRLNQIRVQAMLSDMLNDDVIGSHDPESILQHYNEMSQLTPRAASQPAVVRSQLRQRLQGDTRPFEHNEALNIEKGLKDTQLVAPPEPPKPPPPKKP